MLTDELDFLRESNNIENEWSDLSLQDSIHAWQYATRRKHLILKDVLQIHALLMRTRKTISFSEKGFMRTKPVWIGGHEAMNWTLIPQALKEWLKDVNDITDKGKTELEADKVTFCKLHHIRYEAIHPFIDGNGRTGRIFYNWQRIKLGLPIHIIHTGKEQLEYYKWFDKPSKKT